MRSLLLGLLTSTVTVALILVAAEIGLRFLPVATGLQTEAVNETSPLRHFTANQAYVWSKGWNFSIVNRGRVNNAGFVNEQDYNAAEMTSPLLAVVGDSYVEAVMVPFADTLHGRLAKKFDRGARAYSFAASGAPLSQYLAWADHARRTYHPDAMLFVIIGNDFDESLARYKINVGFHHYVEDAEGTLRLKRFDYGVPPVSWTVKG